ncbi:ATPase, T2SS/T4P/T4SS family [Actimicrobium sp. CCC2.4]|uniref:ATPase, T2SS/T4P/T4SS family n=1 Tax=Actimicrobium sp. CCC2.4 TaxID=3048606 RepID=UPI002AC8EEFF|nr:ATPase, T2SS/T4P/T4SS family [Actimicrobium sp. CCC2.4]MEB0136601.1 ATPase, T2SS/T4P/T4SS family [Actimicrobium sp. CCC2.4]WPX31713.1 ATPase, T2SS/T4P/T4SS family [Actimicrobium sp. CCC2.4]
MLHIKIIDPDGSISTLDVPADCGIGKSRRNEIRLANWRIAQEHARLMTTPSGIMIQCLGAYGGVSLNGERVDVHAGPLQRHDLIGIGPYRLQVAPHMRDSAPAGTTTRADSDIVMPEPAGATDHALVPAGPLVMHASANPAQRELEFDWRRRLHAELLQTMDLRRHDVSTMSDQQLRQDTDALIRQIMLAREADIPSELDRDLLRQQVLNEAIGLGPLEDLLADDEVSEIMVNRYDEIYVERAGRLHRHPLVFTGERAVLGVIERIVAPLGRRIDESSPMVDARLKDGSRVNAIIAPLALKGATLTIRKFARRKLNADDLVRAGSVSAAMAEFLRICVVARKNIVVSGGTGSGKTTLLNILSNFIPDHERVITVEDAAELKLHHAHLISLEARPANVEGKGAVTIRELVRNTLRMRPDRIVVGECRGAEALDMLQAMNTGHEGSLTTLHANTPRDGLARLETMVLMAGMDLPLQAIREQISSAVDIIVQQTRFACGTRMVTSITEITGMESGKILLQELFRFASQGFDGKAGKVRGCFTGCDLVPTFYDDLRAAGITPDMSIFKPDATLAPAPRDLA